MEVISAIPQGNREFATLGVVTEIAATKSGLSGLHVRRLAMEDLPHDFATSWFPFVEMASAQVRRIQSASR